MDQNSNTFEIREGMDVIGSDGETLGSIDHFEGDSMVVKGGMFSGDQLIPISAVTQADANQAYLGVTSAAAMNQQWTAETGTVMGGTSQTMDTTGTWGEPAVDTTTAGTVHHDVVEADVVVETDVVQDRGVVQDRDDLTVELAEEELTARTRQVDRGEVTVSKNVVAEEQTIEVPVTEERVSVSRRVVDRDVAPGDQVFEGGTIEVPVRGEEAVIEKTARIAEEIEISKDVVQETERVTDTVRREEVQIDDSTVRDGTSTSSQTGNRGGRRNN